MVIRRPTKSEIEEDVLMGDPYDFHFDPAVGSSIIEMNAKASDIRYVSECLQSMADAILLYELTDSIPLSIKVSSDSLVQKDVENKIHEGSLCRRWPLLITEGNISNFIEHLNIILPEMMRRGRIGLSGLEYSMLAEEHVNKIEMIFQKRVSEITANEVDLNHPQRVTSLVDILPEHDELIKIPLPGSITYENIGGANEIGLAFRAYKKALYSSELVEERYYYLISSLETLFVRRDEIEKKATVSKRAGLFLSAIDYDGKYAKKILRSAYHWRSEFAHGCLLPFEERQEAEMSLEYVMDSVRRCIAALMELNSYDKNELISELDAAEKDPLVMKRLQDRITGK